MNMRIRQSHGSMHGATCKHVHSMLKDNVLLVMLRSLIDTLAHTNCVQIKPWRAFLLDVQARLRSVQGRNNQIVSLHLSMSLMPPQMV